MTTTEHCPPNPTEKRAARQRGIEDARSEARLKGQNISPQAEPLFARYITSELSRDELLAQLIALYAGR